MAPASVTEEQGGALRLPAHLQGLSARRAHEALVRDYVAAYGTTSSTAPHRSDLDALREAHRFIRSADDDALIGTPVDAAATRLARRYYESLFKEFCLADLSRYSSGQVGLRWRTRREVVLGKGQFTCGAIGCDAQQGLGSYEVPFAYVEAGQRKHALVKLRVCPLCAAKLNYKRERAFHKAERKLRRALKRTRSSNDEDPAHESPSKHRQQQPQQQQSHRQQQRDGQHKEDIGAEVLDWTDPTGRTSTRLIGDHYRQEGKDDTVVGSSCICSSGTNAGKPAAKTSIASEDASHQLAAAGMLSTAGGEQSKKCTDGAPGRGAGATDIQELDDEEFEEHLRKLLRTL